MDNLQKLLDEKWPMRENDKTDAFWKKSALRDAFTKGYNAAINNTYGLGIRPEVVPELVKALENILLDIEPMDGKIDVVAIPKVTVKILKELIKKYKI